MMTDRSNESTEVQFGDPLSLLEVTYRSVAGLLVRSGMTQKSCFTERPTTAWVTVHKTAPPVLSAFLAGRLETLLARLLQSLLQATQLLNLLYSFYSLLGRGWGVGRISPEPGLVQLSQT